MQELGECRRKEESYILEIKEADGSPTQLPMDKTEPREGMGGSSHA